MHSTVTQNYHAVYTHMFPPTIKCHLNAVKVFILIEFQGNTKLVNMIVFTLSDTSSRTTCITQTMKNEYIYKMNLITSIFL